MKQLNAIENSPSEDLVVDVCNRLGVKPYLASYFPTQIGTIINRHPRSITRWGRQGKFGLKKDYRGFYYLTWYGLVRVFNRIYSPSVNIRPVLLRRKEKDF